MYVYIQICNMYIYYAYNIYYVCMYLYMCVCLHIQIHTLGFFSQNKTGLQVLRMEMESVESALGSGMIVHIGKTVTF